MFLVPHRCYKVESCFWQIFSEFSNSGLGVDKTSLSYFLKSFVSVRFGGSAQPINSQARLQFSRNMAHATLTSQASQVHERRMVGTPLMFVARHLPTCF